MKSFDTCGKYCVACTEISLGTLADAPAAVHRGSRNMGPAEKCQFEYYVAVQIFVRLYRHRFHNLQQSMVSVRIAYLYRADAAAANLGFRDYSRRPSRIWELSEQIHCRTLQTRFRISPLRKAACRDEVPITCHRVTLDGFAVGAEGRSHFLVAVKYCESSRKGNCNARLLPRRLL